MAAALVTVPEAPVVKDHSLQPRQDEIRRTRQIFEIESKTMAEPMHDRPHLELKRDVITMQLASFQVYIERTKRKL